MALSDLTRESVLAAIADFDRVGRSAFLKSHGFDKARAYFLVHAGKRYDSKAVAGVAHGHIPGQRPLPAASFSGGEASVRAKLEKLHFVVEGPAHRNPPWSRDELILALDLYFRHRPDTISKGHPEVSKLSEILNELPLQRERPDATRFRNANGVYMKLCNFLRFDPAYKGKGLSAGGKDEEPVWNEFAGARSRLRDVAAAITAGRAAPAAAQYSGADEEEQEAEGFPEGRVLFRLHRSRERSATLRARVTALALKREGRLTCSACGFDFEAKYGDIGAGYIECHHTRPVSELASTTHTMVKDIALLCSNCHRMVHRKRPWMGLATLSQLISSRRT